MDFDRIKLRLDALLEAGKKAELRGALNMLNEVDIADYLETLENDKMLMVFRLLPKDISAEVFSYMDNDQRTRIMEAMDDTEAMRLIDDMFIDDAVDFLEELPAGVVKRMLQGCDETAENVAGTKVDPNRMLLGSGSHGGMVKGGQLNAQLFPLGFLVYDRSGIHLHNGSSPFFFFFQRFGCPCGSAA